MTVIIIHVILILLMEIGNVKGVRLAIIVLNAPAISWTTLTLLIHINLLTCRQHLLMDKIHKLI